MIYFNLKKIWYDKIKSGEKSHEYREVKPHWISRLQRYIDNPNWIEERQADGFPLLAFFRNGYNRLSPAFICQIKSITIINGKDTDLKIDKDVYDIELDLSTLATI